MFWEWEAFANAVGNMNNSNSGFVYYWRKILILQMEHFILVHYFKSSNFAIFTLKFQYKPKQGDIITILLYLVILLKYWTLQVRKPQENWKVAGEGRVVQNLRGKKMTTLDHRLYRNKGIIWIDIFLTLHYRLNFSR